MDSPATGDNAKLPAHGAKLLVGLNGLGGSFLFLELCDKHFDIPEGIPRAVRDRETEATTRKFGGRGRSKA